MNKPNIAQKKSIPIDVEKNKIYYWCKCGLSKKQPFCDGSHKTTVFKPIKYIPEQNKRVFFCGCKYSLKPPFCDGTHKKI